VYWKVTPKSPYMKYTAFRDVPYFILYMPMLDLNEGVRE
jgi:hypothetical protein